MMKRLGMAVRPVALVAVGVVALSACSDMNRTQQRTLSGAAIGTAAGAAGTVVTGGCVSCGAALGGAVGAGTGYIIDRTERHR